MGEGGREGGRKRERFRERERERETQTNLSVSIVLLSPELHQSWDGYIQLFLVVDGPRSEGINETTCQRFS